MKKSMANSLINGEHILKLIGWGAKGSQTLRHILSLLLVLMLTACAHWADRQEPEVHLTKVEPLPSAGLEQRFLIGLRIVNPNNAPLAVSGLSYSLSLQDSKVITGVSSKIIIGIRVRGVKRERGVGLGATSNIPYINTISVGDSS